MCSYILNSWRHSFMSRYLFFSGQKRIKSNFYFRIYWHSHRQSLTNLPKHVYNCHQFTLLTSAYTHHKYDLISILTNILTIYQFIYYIYILFDSSYIHCHWKTNKPTSLLHISHTCIKQDNKGNSVSMTKNWDLFN